MRNSITDVPGILVGQAQDAKAATGCTVILCETSTATGVDVRGGAPGTRETDCLDPINIVPAAHAIFLGGGSAFGLDGVTGVMRYLETKGVGFDVGVTRVPIVPAAVLFDLGVGDAFVRPDERMGREACENAGVEVAQGNFGAGTGCSIGKAGGPSRMMKGGLGTASVACGPLVVGAIAAVNCVGDIVDPRTGRLVAGTLDESGRGLSGSYGLLTARIKCPDIFSTNTSIGVVATNANLTKPWAKRVALMAHDGFARAIVPAHTSQDGDTIFCTATGQVEADLNVVGSMAAEAMARAVLNAVMRAATAYGLPGYEEISARAEGKGR
jgi:L-aminopeptidase/D-esterase-like protein